MFTGIVKGKAPVIEIEQRDAILRYAVAFPQDLLNGLETGASVSVDGVCQTVVAIEGRLIWFEAIEETLNRTTLKSLKNGRDVNLERSARIGDEIGGHLLSGHIYGTAAISEIEKNIYSLKCPPEWMKYLFSKGFIAIDGISLTLVDVNRKEGVFTVHLIPETLQRTILGSKSVGDFVNLEFDALTQAAVETVENLIFAQKQNLSH